ncbi:MAG: YggS family pyridoxal phosphate-dependent enzyme [Clostridia bacterium]|nr:YggS family pyridoxal phosphate-dependent enzyme [Clostridia bacterium]
MSDLSYMDRNYQEINGRIREAERRAGRSDVRLVAAVKYTDAEHIDYLHRVLGVNDVGENRVQQLLSHWETVDREGLNFHFIGTLQTNKVKYIADKVCMIHSLDSLKLAAEIEKQMAKLGRTMDVLVEINSGAEENKSGVSPEDAAELCLALRDFSHVNLRGFMTMAPKCEKNEEYRKFFQETFQLGLDIWQKKLHNIGRPLFSMGMSGNFEIAIEEGANMVRVGRALFAEPIDSDLKFDI